MNDESLRAVFEAERDRLATSAPAPRFTALERRIAAERLARLDRLAQLCVACASAVLLAAILVATLAMPDSRVALALAAALVWIILGQAPSARLALN